VKILHLISSGGMYGAEAVILNLSRTLNRQGHSSILGIFSNSARPNLQLHECALAEGIDSYLIACKGQIDTTVPASIRALATSTGADIVHAHGYKADIYASLAMSRTSVPLVSTCHNWIDDDLFVRTYGTLDRWMLRRYDAVIAVSQAVKQRLLSSAVPEASIHLIRNGIDLRPFDTATPSLRSLVPDPEALLVGWVGRLSSEKGPDLFVRAAAEIHQSFPSAHFLLIGDGPDRASLEALIQNLGIAPSVHLVGRRTDMPAVYASLDIAVSSSRREGLPMAILEGMASRLPWVATDVGDVPQLIQDGHTGILVPPEDTTALARAVTTLLGNAEVRRRLGTAARHLVENDFSAEKMTDEYLAVYSRAATALPVPHSNAEPSRRTP